MKIFYLNVIYIVYELLIWLSVFLIWFIILFLPWFSIVIIFNIENWWEIIAFLPWIVIAFIFAPIRKKYIAIPFNHSKVSKFINKVQTNIIKEKIIKKCWIKIIEDLEYLIEDLNALEWDNIDISQLKKWYDKNWPYIKNLKNKNFRKNYDIEISNKTFDYFPKIEFSWRVEIHISNCDINWTLNLIWIRKLYIEDSIIELTETIKADYIKLSNIESKNIELLKINSWYTTTELKKYGIIKNKNNHYNILEYESDNYN